jgi:uncharacterized protein with beta-barrel porin domain
MRKSKDKSRGSQMSIRAETESHGDLPSPARVGALERGLRPRAIVLFLSGCGAVASPALAGSGSCGVGPSITIGAPVSGECRLDDGDNLVVEQDGSITGGPNGVRINFPNGNATIDNAGVLRGQDFHGVFVDGGEVTLLRNSGVIEGNQTGFASNSYGVVNFGIIEVLTNESSGVIGGRSGIAIRNQNRLDVLNNRGRIAGAVNTQNTQINLLGTTGSIEGNVVNTGGSVNVRSSASFATMGTLTSATFLVESGGRLRIGSSGHGITVTSSDADAFRNAGVLQVADGIEGRIEGNYTQSGVLRVGASSASSHGRLTVTGRVVLTSSAGFDVDVSTSNTLAAGDTLSGVLVGDGGLDNGASTANVTDNSALFNFRSASNGNQIDLQVVAAGSAQPSQPAQSSQPDVTPVLPEAAPSGQGIVPATVRAGLANGVPTAQVLDGYIRGGRTGTDWDAVVTALGQLPDDASVAGAVGQAMPSMHGNAARALLAHVSSTGSAVNGQLTSGDAAGRDPGPGTGLWVKPLGSWVEQDRRRQVSGYRVRSQGLVGGHQTSFGRGGTIGLGLAYLDGRIEGRDFAVGHRNDLESVQVLGYGAHDLSGLRLQWQADATRSTVKSMRGLGFIGRSARASYRGNSSHLGVSVGRPMDVAGTAITPSVGFDWRRVRSNAHTEAGAGALDLRVAAQKAEEMTARLGMEARLPLGPQSHLLAQAAVGYDLASGRDTTSAQFAGGGAVFATHGTDRQRTLAELGLGLLHRVSGAVEVRVRYDLSLRGGMTDQAVSLRLDWRF